MPAMKTVPTEHAWEGELVVAAVSDLHYVRHARRTPSCERFHSHRAADLLRRVVARLKAAGAVHAILVLGDVVDDGNAPGVEADLADLREVLYRSGAPFILAPGNHDGDPERLLEFFGEQPGPHTVNGYVLYSFADRYYPGDTCVRSGRDLDALQDCVMARPEHPFIVVQHNPVFPPITSDYPYNLKNAEMVASAYSTLAVVLSVSGHYHAGQPLAFRSGVGYVTCPALCEEPFRYLLIKVHGGEVECVPQQIALQAPCPLADVHVHTQMAYCSEGITAQGAAEEARLVGLDQVAIVEHADQLYMDWDTFHSQALLAEPDLAWRMRAEGRDRFRAYRELVAPLRSERVKVGLEVECNARFEPVLLEEDRQGWDLLLGAVHWITDEMAESCGGVEHAYLRLVDALINTGVDVLAHPMRFFRRHGLPLPRDLYRPLVQMLADEGVAAELNFHTNEPDPEFFALCLEEGVRIALGSDSHQRHEVGELGPHLSFLRRLGVSDDLLPEILYRLPSR